MGEHNNKIVKQEEIGKFFVSTVFLGFDHDWSFKGPPLLFETMVFHKEGGSADNAYFNRTWTWELALDKHAEAVVWAREHQNG
jgi:hypothetical protein